MTTTIAPRTAAENINISIEAYRAEVAAKEAAQAAIDNAVPVVGDGATVYHYSDASAWTVVAVGKSGRTATLQRDTATLLNGCNSGEVDALTFAAGGFCGHTSGTQRYSYERNTDGVTIKITMRKDGKWRTAGRVGERVRMGRRSEHYDFNF